MKEIMANGIRGFRNSPSARMVRARTPDPRMIRLEHSVHSPFDVLFCSFELRMPRLLLSVAFYYRSSSNHDAMLFQCSHIVKRFDHQSHDDMNELRTMVRFNIHIENNPTSMDREAKRRSYG